LYDGGTLPAPDVSGVGRVLYYAYIPVTIPANVQKIIVSRNPDGTGDAHVGDALQLFAYYGGGSIGEANNRYTPGCVPQQPSVMPPWDVTSFFTHTGPHTAFIRYLDWCGGEKTVDPIYLVIQTNSVTPTPTTAPTATPTSTPLPTVAPIAIPTPTMIPSGPSPFLELPWNYKAHDLTFTDAALRMSAYFDHEYPLLSSTLAEPTHSRTSVVTFKDAAQSTEAYSSHDGYDYAGFANALIGEPVLAAAAGTATFKNTCPACGNAILIDHGNGFQTRYYHMQKNGLITSIPNHPVHVTQGQAIGRIGATGNVSPSGNQGAHIHFMVVEDKNHDGDFEDNIPDGLVDPFGWQDPNHPDPWAFYAFNYKDKARLGNASSYLWSHPFENTREQVSTAGSTVSLSHASLNFPAGVSNGAFTVDVKADPHVALSDTLSSVGYSISVSAKDALNKSITQFNKMFTVSFNISNFDWGFYKKDSYSIYSSQDGIFWHKEESGFDPATNTVSTQVNHLTHFALFAQKKDVSAPMSTISLDGLEGQQNMYRSHVQLSLSASDGGDEPSGVSYIIYKLDEGDWDQYINPVDIPAEGHHTVQYYSVDHAGNGESVHTEEFDIDTTVPEASVQYDVVKKAFTASSARSTDTVTTKTTQSDKQTKKTTLTDRAGNSITIVYRENRDEEESELHLLSLQYNEDDPIVLSANKVSAELETNRDKSRIVEFNQSYSVKNELKVRLQYLSKTDKTKIITREKGKDVVKEEKAGMKSLQLVTGHGTVNYAY
jgi:murein DD-endopeptidase MepM/ murein hydrolase activator NlpD